jgi:hypothetical protein
MRAVTIVLACTLCWQSAHAQFAGGIPPMSYFLFNLTAEGFVRCESQHAELNGSTEKFLDAVQARAPGMFNGVAFAEIKLKLQSRIHEEAQQKPVTLAECKTFSADESAIQRIAHLCEEDAADAANNALIKERTPYWESKSPPFVPCFGIQYKEEEPAGRSTRLFAGKPWEFLVTGVQEGSPASSAGIRAGDKIVSFGDHIFARTSDFAAFEYVSEPGSVNLMVVERNGVEVHLQMLTGQRSLVVPVDLTCREYKVYSSSRFERE